MYEEAVHAFDQAIRLDPGLAEAYYRRAGRDELAKLVGRNTMPSRCAALKTLFSTYRSDLLKSLTNY